MSQTQDTRARSNPGAQAIWGRASPTRRVTLHFSLEPNTRSPLGQTQIHMGPSKKQERSLHFRARLKQSTMAGPFQRKHAWNRCIATTALQQCNCGGHNCYEVTAMQTLRMQL